MSLFFVRCPCSVRDCEEEAEHAQDWHPVVQGQGQGGQGTPAVQEVHCFVAIEQNHNSILEKYEHLLLILICG